ncbi:WD40 repeat-like protein [Ceratobasidium sp. AG-I]|nr:WD40 repeat-like protein [Ceratobasidium sp. AG-I]
MASKLPPPPFRVLRAHTVQINTLQFSGNNEFIIAGDSSGRVSVTSTRTFRPVADWVAHTDGVLGVQEWDECIITHGRDNKLHVWRLAPAVPLLADAAGTPTLENPTNTFSLDVNSLNYCRFSLYSVPGSSPSRTLLALPNLIESELIDVWEIPSATRLHAGIGTVKGAAPRKPFSDEGRDVGIVMALHVSQTSTHMRVLAAYESGTVTLWSRGLSDKLTSVEGNGWENVWSVKHHLEAVMGMAVTRDNSLAITVSADHLICRYDLINDLNSTIVHPQPLATKYPGNSAVAFRADGRVAGVAGWDGAIRLYSTGQPSLSKLKDETQSKEESQQPGSLLRKMRSLGTLDYFKESCFALAFSGATGNASSSEFSASGGAGDVESSTRCSNWLVVGGKNGRVAIWELDSFEKRGP